MNCLAGSGGSLSLNSGGTLSESVLESARHMTQVSHSSGTCSLSSDSLDTPVILPNLGGRVSTRRAHLLLDVERTLTAPNAQRVRLVMTLT